MRPTRTSTLAIVAVVCAVAAWLLLRSVYQHLPPLPWTGVPALLVAAAAEAWIGPRPAGPDRGTGRRQACRTAVRIPDGRAGQG